jgi:hypothetical protein
MTNRRSKVKIVGLNNLVLSSSCAVHESFVVGVSRALAACNDSQKENALSVPPHKVISESAKAILKDLSFMAPILVSNNQSIDSAADVDPDEFMDYARAAIQNNNKSYDPASFKDFESLLEESINSHFLDDDDDDEDSMTSASSFSGYDDHEACPKKHLKQNALISEVSSHRLNGTIARRKSKEGARQEGDDDTIFSKLSSCITIDAEDDGSSNESTIATGTSCRPRSKLMKADPRVYLRRYDIKFDENSLISDNSYQPELIQRRNDIKFDENSLISDNSYQPELIQRRITRIRQRKQSKTDHSVESENGREDVEQKIDDLVFVLTQERVERGDSSSPILDAHNKDAILSSLKQTSPALYEILLSRLENRDMHDTPPVSGNEVNASQGDLNISSHSAPLHRTIKIACSTPDKTYEADKSQLESTLEDDHAGLSAMDLRDTIYISESSLNQSPRLSLSESPSNSDNVTDSSRRVSFTADSPTHIGHLKAAHDELSLNTSGLNISVDSGNMFLPSIDEVDNGLDTIVESSDSQDGWDLDEMIELFLNHKIETLKERMVQRQMALARKDNELKAWHEAMAREEWLNSSSSLNLTSSRHANQSIDGCATEPVRAARSAEPDQELGNFEKAGDPLKGYRSRSYWHARVRDSAESMRIVHPDQDLGNRGFDSSTEQSDILVQNSTCKKGRELIRRIQSKRETIAKARQERQDTSDVQRSTKEDVVPHLQCDQSIATDAIPKSPRNIGGPGDEECLENFINRKPLPIDAKKRKPRNLKVRRRSLLRSQNSSRDEMLCPLQAPIEEADDLVPNVSLSSPMVVKRSLRFGRSRTDSSYEVLPEKENSFVAADMDSEGIIQAFEPPSPESPIRDYRLPNFTDIDTSDAVQSEDTGFSSVRFDSGISASPSEDFSDSFDGIVFRTTPKNVEHGWGEDNNEVSPTTVGGFFDVFEQPKPKVATSTLAFLDEDEPDPVFVDDDDFIQENSYQIESGVMTGFVEATFLTSNRFEV